MLSPYFKFPAILIYFPVIFLSFCVQVQTFLTILPLVKISAKTEPTNQYFFHKLVEMCQSLTFLTTCSLTFQYICTMPLIHVQQKTQINKKL